ncbi:MAG TPA: hypothetical protein VGJ30_07065 [Candidatus Angelobacter sp.]
MGKEKTCVPQSGRILPRQAGSLLAWQPCSSAQNKQAQPIQPGRLLFYLFVRHFGGAGAGPSGWQTPVVPFTPMKQMPHGFRQVVVLVQVWPQVAPA